MLSKPSLLLFPLVLLSGCAASLDSVPDINHSAQTIQQRTGLLPGWLDTTPSTAIPENLTSTDAARLALANDPRLRAALHRIASARADLVQAGLLPNPVLALDLGFPIDGSGGATKVGVSLTQQLAAILSRGDRQSAADAALREQVLSTSDLALRTVAHARAAHARVLFAQSAIAPMQESVAAAEHAVDTARRRLAAGEDNSLEVNRQRLAFARLSAELLQRQTDLELRKRELLARLGLAANPAELTVSGAPSDSPSAAPMPETESETIADALQYRLDLAAARAAADSARARIGIERKSRFDLSAGPAFERTDDKRKELGPSIQASIPIFDTGDARIAKAHAEAARLALEADEIEQSSIAEARAAYLTAKSARALAARYESEVAALSDTNLALAQRAFTAGQTDLTVLLESRQSAIDARLKLIDLQEKAALADIELRRAIGR